MWAKIRRLGLIFPGQGAQRPGGGADLFAAFPAARAVFEEVDDALRAPLSRALFSGDATALARTRVAQPALLAHSVAAFRVAADEAGVSAAGAAAALGHSVGEYAALVCAGALPLAGAARVLGARAAAMQAAADAAAEGGRVLGMTAVLLRPAARGADGDGSTGGGPGAPRGRAGDAAAAGAPGAAGAAADDAARDAADAAALQRVAAAGAAACAAARARTRLVVAVAAVNSPLQLVLSGDAAAMDAAVAELRGGGGGVDVARVVRLAVSAPFHCEVMAPAAGALERALAAEPPLARPLAPLVANATAAPEADPAALAAALVAAVTAPVPWAACVRAAAGRARAGGAPPAAALANGPATAWAEFGPGATLGALVAATLARDGARAPDVVAVGTVEDIKALRRRREAGREL